MNILMVTPYFHPVVGGLENYSYNVAKRLVQKGHNITVICSSRDNTDTHDTIDGIEISRLRPDFIASNTPVKLSLLFKLSQHIRKHKPDLVSAHTPVVFYADAAAIASRLHHVPFSLTYHNDSCKDAFPANAIVDAHNHSVNLLTLKLSQLIITPSPHCYNESRFLKRFKNKVVWIPPGVDTQKYEPKESTKLQSTYGLPLQSKIVLFVGQISRAHAHKGIDYLIRSFRKVLDHIENVYLVLVGKGDMIPEYKRTCESLGMARNVVFTDFVDEDRLVEYYQSSHVLVLPTTTIAEGFGMVIVEANACGKPVVGTRIGGIQYVIRDGETGLLVPPRDSEALADALLDVLRQPCLYEKLAMGTRRRAHEFCWDKIARKTEEVFQELIAK